MGQTVNCHSILVAIILAVATNGLKITSASDSFGHSNNWAVLVDTSRYWFNYRHIANTLSIYTTVKR